MCERRERVSWAPAESDAIVTVESSQFGRSKMRGEGGKVVRREVPFERGIERLTRV